MACDQWLLQNARRLGWPVLRVYGWDRPSISIGYFQPYPSQVGAHYTVVRRPTGGGLVFHDFDLTFTVALPPSHPWRKLNVCERYARVHERICGVFEQRGQEASLASFDSRFTNHAAMPDLQPSVFSPQSSVLNPPLCFARSTRYDVVIAGVKVAGGAQRVTRDGLIHQGSIQPGDGPAVLARELKEAWERSGVNFEKLVLSFEHRAEIDELVTTQFGVQSWNEHGGRGNSQRNFASTK